MIKTKKPKKCKRCTWELAWECEGGIASDKDLKYKRTYKFTILACYRCFDVRSKVKFY